MPRAVETAWFRRLPIADQERIRQQSDKLSASAKAAWAKRKVQPRMINGWFKNPQTGTVTCVFKLKPPTAEEIEEARAAGITDLDLLAELAAIEEHEASSAQLSDEEFLRLLGGIQRDAGT